MAATGARLLSLDQAVDLREARKAVGWGVGLGGNADPVRLKEKGTPDEVLAAGRAAIGAGGPRRFNLIAGCAPPPATLPENGRALAAGFDPTPAYREPLESRISRPDVAKDYPLILMTGARLPATSASWTHNLPTLRALVQENWVEVHPETAGRLGIRDGARVAVETPRGRIELPARDCDTVPPPVASIPVGWGRVDCGRLAAATPGANPNVLIDHTNLDPIAGTSGYKSSLCRLVPPPA